MSETFRAFIALPLSAPVLDVLLETQARLRRKAERSGLDLRWTRAEQLHVTVTFLGNVPRDHEERLKEILGQVAAEHDVMDREIGEIGFFGPPSHARVLHVPIPDADGALRHLAAGLADATEPLGVEREVRPYRPHVTLARFRRPGSVRALLHEGALPTTSVCLDRLHLYESRPSSGGSHYTLLSECLLRRPAG